MSVINEKQYEEKLLKQISELGYKYISQENLLKIRETMNEVLLFNNIEKSLLKINPKIVNDHINKVILKLKDLKNSDLISGNKEFQKYIVEGIKIYDNDEQITKTYYLFDENYSKNEYIITNQFIMNSSHPQYNKQYPDIVIYCNGIPIVVMELKTLSKENNISFAYSQIKNYQIYLKDLFVYNAFNIIANPLIQKFGSITSELSRYQFWRGSNFSSPTDEIFNDLLKKERIIDVIKNFTFFTSGKFSNKIIASYHQYYGVKSSIIETNKEMSNKERKKIGKGGIFWHTQGSGKSFSMIFLVKNISKIQKETTFLIVTDRNDLDNQLHKTFIDAKEFIGQKIHKISSIKDLKESLNNRKQNGVFFTTIQKFTNDIGRLSDRKNILVISDEAHRSHTNVDGERWAYNTKTKNIENKKGNAIFLREAFPRATFIGFTGTPIEKEDKSTIEIFGKIISKYLMNDAERDGVVVEIKYESRKPIMEIDNKKMEELIEEHNQIMNEIENSSEAPNEVQKKLNKVLQQVKNVVSDPDRIKGISSDFIAHYNSRKNIVNGKAMFVAFNRHTAFKYYKEIIKQNPKLEKNIKLIITNSNGQKDDPELLKLSGTSEYRKKMAEKFKDEDSEFKIAIVVDMWLTGFDVPSLDAIYIDKPIKMHNLMQTIARINRVYTKSNINKEYGLVIDYIGLWNKLIDALSFYTGKNNIDIKNKRDIKNLKIEYIKKINKIYEKFKIDNLIDFKLISINSEKRIETLIKLLEIIYENKMVQNFISATKNVNKWFNETISLLTSEERSKFQLLWMMRSGMISNELGKINFDEKELKLLNHLSKTIKFKETEVINSIEGNPIILSKILKYIDEENNKESKYLETSIKSGMLKSLIDYTKKINFRRASNLEEKLKQLLINYDNKYINIEKLIEGMKSIANEIAKLNENQKNELGYTQEEQAFFDIIRMPVKNLPKFDQLKIKEITNELLEILKDSNKVNETWKYNDNMIRKVRGELKKLLIKHKYPPKEIKDSAEEIVDQVIYQKNWGDR